MYCLQANQTSDALNNNVMTDVKPDSSIEKRTDTLQDKNKQSKVRRNTVLKKKNMSEDEIMAAIGML